jgi:hypothetical protein
VALERDAVLDKLKVGLAARRVQRDRPGVVDDAAQRQDRAVADHHAAGIMCGRRLIEHEVVRVKRCGTNAVQGDRLAISKRDHSIAISVVGGVCQNVSETGESRIANEIDLIGAGIEAVNDVVADWLREHQEVVPTRSS